MFPCAVLVTVLVIGEEHPPHPPTVLDRRIAEAERMHGEIAKVADDIRKTLEQSRQASARAKKTIEEVDRWLAEQAAKDRVKQEQKKKQK